MNNGDIASDNLVRLIADDFNSSVVMTFRVGRVPEKQ